MDWNDKIVAGAKKVFKDCLGVKPGEKVLVVCDEQKIDVAYPFSAAARRMGLNIVLMECSSKGPDVVPTLVADAMRESDVIIAITTRSYSHTAAKFAACEAGARVATMPMLTAEIAENYLIADYGEISRRSLVVADLLSKAKTARITTDFGTDLRLGLEGRKGIADTGILLERGASGNIPSGEGFIAPLENGAEGTYVVMPGDCITGLGKIQDRITLTLHRGRIRTIRGARSAELLKEFLKDKDEEADGIAELGVGTNPKAKLIGNPLLDEKVMGTVHIAFGTNKFFGGERLSNIHYDCIIHQASLFLDGECVMDRGDHVYEKSVSPGSPESDQPV